MRAARPGTVDQDRPELTVVAASESVLAAPGRPGDLFRVGAHPPWPGRYRANVAVGSASSPRVAHSFFVAADDRGRIVRSVPKTARLY